MMKSIKRSLCAVCILLICSLLGGCGGKINFSYYYRGFVIRGNEDVLLPVGTYVIVDQDMYDDFFSTYSLGAIYQLDTVDFETESLIYVGYQSAQMTRGNSREIKYLKENSDGGFDIIMDETVAVGGKNADQYMAYQILTDEPVNVTEVYILKVKKSDLSNEIAQEY